MRTLAKELKALELPVIEGAGADPTGDWPEEKSVFVLGVDLDAAEALGRRYQQKRRRVGGGRRCADSDRAAVTQDDVDALATRRRGCSAGPLAKQRALSGLKTTEGFVWVEVLGSDGDRVMREQRICERPADIGAAVGEFKTKYLNDGWSE